MRYLRSLLLLSFAAISLLSCATRRVVSRDLAEAPDCTKVLTYSAGDVTRLISSALRNRVIDQCKTPTCAALSRVSETEHLLAIRGTPMILSEMFHTLATLGKSVEVAVWKNRSDESIDFGGESRPGMIFSKWGQIPNELWISKFNLKKLERVLPELKKRLVELAQIEKPKLAEATNLKSGESWNDPSYQLRRRQVAEELQRKIIHIFESYVGPWPASKFFKFEGKTFTAIEFGQFINETFYGPEGINLNRAFVTGTIQDSGSTEKNDLLLKRIMDLIDQDLPVGISYLHDFRFLRKRPGVRPLLSWSNQKCEDQKKSEDYHRAVIVGYIKDPKNRLKALIIQNSHGINGVDEKIEMDVDFFWNMTTTIEWH